MVAAVGGLWASDSTGADSLEVNFAEHKVIGCGIGPSYMLAACEVAVSFGQNEELMRKWALKASRSNRVRAYIGYYSETPARLYGWNGNGKHFNNSNNSKQTRKDGSLKHVLNRSMCWRFV